VPEVDRQLLEEGRCSHPPEASQRLGTFFRADIRRDRKRNQSADGRWRDLLQGTMQLEVVVGHVDVVAIGSSLPPTGPVTVGAELVEAPLGVVAALRELAYEASARARPAGPDAVSRSRAAVYSPSARRNANAKASPIANAQSA
jgi:hypothetical protein